MLICHTSDWHLAASGSKRAPSGRNARLEDRCRCARFVVEDAVKRGADLIVHCGDVFDRWHVTPTEVRLAKQAFVPALDAKIPVVIVKGNHDDVRSPTEFNALDHLREMVGVTVVDQPCLLDVWEGSHRTMVTPSPEKRPEVDSTMVQLACLPYPQPNLLLRDEDTRQLSPGERNLLIREKMMEVARGLAADRREGVPRLLLGHFSVDMAEAGQQNRLMALGGEFTLNVHELAALGFEAVLLGHIHKGQTFPKMPVVYSGSPEACSFGEEGEPKYYLLVSPHEDDEHKGYWNIGFEMVATPYRPLVTLDPLQDFTDEGELTAEAPVVEHAIVRVELPAGSPLDLNAVRREVEACGAFEVRVTKARAETERRVRESDVSHGQALPEQINAWLEFHPDYQPHADALIAEAVKLEEAVAEGGAA